MIFYAGIVARVNIQPHVGEGYFSRAPLVLPRVRDVQELPCELPQNADADSDVNTLLELPHALLARSVRVGSRRRKTRGAAARPT